MNIEFTGRKIEITPALRRFTEGKLKKLERLLDGIVEAHVVLRVEKHRQDAEMIVHSRHATLSGSESTDDLYASISGVIDKLERQAKKHKEKFSWGKKKVRGVATIRTAVDQEAAPALPGPREGRVIRSRRYAVKPMSVDEAVLQVQSSESSFIVFRDASNQRVNVLYKRHDGNFGLIEPEI
jgi:putative sigma-54 modulation protein